MGPSAENTPGSSSMTIRKNGWAGSCSSMVQKLAYHATARMGSRRALLQPTLDASHFADNAASHAAYAAHDASQRLQDGRQPVLDHEV
jgi:hypothetical protein